jgi:Protein of unknown function (DUF2568)
MQGSKGIGMAALAMRFFVEVLGIVAVAFWGWQTGPDGIGRIALAVGAAVALIVVWGFVVAPKADNPLRQQARDIVGTVLLLVAAAGLAAAGQPQLALVFAVVIVVDWLALVVIAPDAHQALRSSAAGSRR